MDRAVLESDPFRVVEGMLIAAYAIGATKGYVYCRAEYPLAIERLARPSASAARAGLLGRDILGSLVDFDITIKMGAGAFVCGEETAILASIEGGRGMPRPRPPYPGRVRPARLPDGAEQRGDAGQRAGRPRQRRRVVPRPGRGDAAGTKVFAL